MDKRIQLTWSRSKDDNVKRYRVYRSTNPDVKRSDLLVMEVDHIRLPKPIAVVADKLKRNEDGTYSSKYKNLMPDQEDYPIRIYLNGIDVNDLNISNGVDIEDGTFYFDVQFGENDELVASYHIDAIRVYDTDEIEQEGVKYNGPTARDRTENTIPQNVVIVSEEENGRIALKWKDSDTQGQQYYYRVESIDEYGNFSILSIEASTFLREGLATEAYIVERSYNEVNWTVVAKPNAPEYFEYGIDTNPPSPPVDLTGKSAIVKGTSKGDVTLEWKEPSLGLSSITGQYRVRSQSVLGVVSPPSLVVGPVYLTSNIAKYVIRRKVYDGQFPSYIGNDGVTVGIVASDVFKFVDYGADDETRYAYSVYAVDAAENVSAAATILVEIADASPPPKVTGITVAEHDYLIYPGDKPPLPVTGLRSMRHNYIIAYGDNVAPYPVDGIRSSTYFVGI